MGQDQFTWDEERRKSRQGEKNAQDREMELGIRDQMVEKVANMISKTQKNSALDPASIGYSLSRESKISYQQNRY